jgi:hypothetical protein
MKQADDPVVGIDDPVNHVRRRRSLGRARNVTAARLAALLDKQHQPYRASLLLAILGYLGVVDGEASDGVGARPWFPVNTGTLNTPEFGRLHSEIAGLAPYSGSSRISPLAQLGAPSTRLAVRPSGRKPCFPFTACTGNR